MFTAAGGNIDGVLAANDDLGNAAITILKKNGQDRSPVTGQDASVQGLQNILAGDQCMTVFKDVKKEADAAVQARDRPDQGPEPGDRRRHHEGARPDRQP